MKGAPAGFLIPLFLWAQKPTKMEFVGSWPFGPAHTVTADPQRSLIFLGAGGGVYVLDVSYPSHPQKVSEEIRTREPVVDLFYDEHRFRLYVAGERTVDIWDVRDPVSPVRLGEMVLQSVSGIFVAGTLAYVADEEVGLYVFDVAHPSHPEILTLDQNPAEYPRDVYVAGSFAYVISPHTLRVLDVSNPRSLQEAGMYETPEWKDVQDIVVSGSHAYVVDRYAGLRVVDVSDPHAPHEVGFYDTPGRTERVDVAGSHAYVADVVALHVIDVSHPSSPKEAGLEREGATDVYVHGSYAFVVDGNLRVVEISDPDSLKPVGVFVTPGSARKIQVAGSLAYLGTTNGLFILDLSDPSHPEEVGAYPTRGSILDLEVKEGYAYVVVKERGLFVVDVSNPSHPKELGHGAIPGWVDHASVDISGSYVYLVYGPSLHIVDVSDPFHPREVGRCKIGRHALDVDVSGPYAYVVEEEGLQIVDISDPFSPRKIGVYRAPKLRARQRFRSVCLCRGRQTSSRDRRV